MKRLLLSAATAMVLTGLGAAPAVAQSSGLTFRYVASFVCGLNPAAPPRVLPGRYATTILLHNSGRRSVIVSAVASLTFPGSRPVVDQADIPLQAGEVNSIDCSTLMLDGGPPYTQGVVVIEASQPLVVRRVQTAGAAGNVASIDVDDVAAQRLIAGLPF